jgi:hypothetical protein
LAENKLHFIHKNGSYYQIDPKSLVDKLNSLDIDRVSQIGFAHNTLYISDGAERIISFQKRPPQ